jgi:hypothetical protein
LIATLSDLVAMLTGERPQVETTHAAAAKLAEALSDRPILVVVDDVWRKQDVEPFLQGGRHCVGWSPRGSTAFCRRRPRGRRSTRRELKR